MSDLNDPRVLLAAERTLMAWNRTGISLMAFGFAVERFGLFMDIYAKGNLQESQRHLSFVGGLGFIALGGLQHHDSSETFCAPLWDKARNKAA